MRVRSLEEAVLLSALLNIYLIQIRQIKPRDEKRERILVFLFMYEKRVTQAQLAEFTRLSVSQIQKLTVEMVQKGLATRDLGAPAGGMWISLTKNGKRHTSRLLEDRARALKNGLAPSSPKPRSKNATSTLSVLNANLVSKLRDVV